MNLTQLTLASHNSLMFKAFPHHVVNVTCYLCHCSQTFHFGLQMSTKLEEEMKMLSPTLCNPSLLLPLGAVLPRIGTPGLGLLQACASRKP